MLHIVGGVILRYTSLASGEFKICHDVMLKYVAYSRWCNLVTRRWLQV